MSMSRRLPSSPSTRFNKAPVNETIGYPSAPVKMHVVVNLRAQFAAAALVPAEQRLETRPIVKVANGSPSLDKPRRGVSSYQPCPATNQASKGKQCGLNSPGPAPV